MEPTTIILGLAVLFGLYMAWNIGANDVANAMGTSVGSHALTIRQAVIVAAIFEFAGAFLVGGQVTQTIQKGIIDPTIYQSEPLTLAVGMLAAMLAAALWLQLASAKGLPVSTTHAIVGAVLGFGIVSAGFDAVSWGRLSGIVASWFVSPVCGGIIAFTIFYIIRRYILDAELPLHRTKLLSPVLLLVVGSVLMLVLLFKGLKNLNLELSATQIVAACVAFGGVLAVVAMFALRGFDKVEVERSEAHRRVEKVFGWLQIITACFMAFAHGSNDVANAVGPLAGIVTILDSGKVSATGGVPTWVLVLGGIGIVIGLATYGARVIETVGKNITEMTPTRGFAAEFGAALTILVGSQLGLPLSTTHILVGAVIGVGFARGIAALNLRVIRSVATSWVITVPATAIVAIALYYPLRWLLL
jgi:PiT family inorganic phosphate transporter